MSFVERHTLWSASQQAAALQVEKDLASRGIEVVRFSFPDQHGILRGKTLVASEAAAAMRGGVSLTSTLLAKDTAHKSAFPVFSAGGGFGMSEMQGGADFILIADPTTFRVLPWAPHTAWMLCDAYFPDGTPVPYATRRLYTLALARLADAGYELMAGLEVEFHVFKLTDPHLQPQDAGQPGTPPEVSLLSQGYQYLTELRYDQIDPVV